MEGIAPLRFINPVNRITGLIALSTVPHVVEATNDHTKDHDHDDDSLKVESDRNGCGDALRCIVERAG